MKYKWNLRDCVSAKDPVLVTNNELYIVNTTGLCVLYMYTRTRSPGSLSKYDTYGRQRKVYFVDNARPVGTQSSYLIIRPYGNKIQSYFSTLHTLYCTLITWACIIKNLPVKLCFGRFVEIRRTFTTSLRTRSTQAYLCVNYIQIRPGGWCGGVSLPSPMNLPIGTLIQRVVELVIY